MDKSTMENDPARMQMTHIAASGMTTIALSEDKPTTDSTDLGSERNEFTATASRSHIQWLLEEMTEEQANQLMYEFLASWTSLTAESWDAGSGQITLQSQTSNGGSTGPSPEEVEP